MGWFITLRINPDGRMAASRSCRSPASLQIDSRRLVALRCYDRLAAFRQLSVKYLADAGPSYGRHNEAQWCPLCAQLALLRHELQHCEQHARRFVGQTDTR